MPIRSPAYAGFTAVKCNDRHIARGLALLKSRQDGAVKRTDNELGVFIFKSLKIAVYGHG